MSRGNLATLDTNEDEKTNGSSNSYTNGAEHSTLPRVLSRASLGAGRQQSESSIFSRKLPSSFKFSLPSKASMPSSMSDLSNKLKRTSSSSKQLSKNFQSTNFWSTIGSVIQAGGRLHHNTVGVLRHAVDKRLKTKKELEKYHLIHPEKAWKKRWDLFFAIAILITTGYIPFHIAYGKFIQNDYLSDTVFESLTVVIYSTNILIHFNTAQIDPVTGYLVARRITLANRYLAFEFWVDLVAAFPFDLIIQASLTAHNQQAGFVLPLLRIIRFIMLFKIPNLIRSVEFNPFTGLLFVFFQLLFVAHTVCCFWFFLGHYYPVPKGEGLPSSWIDAFTPAGYGVKDYYIVSMYFVLYTMLAIGFGDIHAVNLGERVFAIFTGIIGAVMLGIVLAQVLSILSAANPVAVEKESRMNEFLDYIDCSKNLSLRLKSRAIGAYSYYLDKMADVEATKSLRGIPHILLSNLVVSTFGQTIRRVRFFDHTIENDFVVDFLLAAIPGQASKGRPGDAIAKAGDIGTEVVFVLRGTVQLWSLQMIEAKGADGTIRRVKVRVVEGYASQGSYFGDLEYLYKSNRLVNYTVVHASEFLSINYGKLKSLLAKYEGACAKMIEECRKRLKVFNETSSSPIIRFADNEGYSRETIWVDGESEFGGSYEEVNKSQAAMPLTYSIITAIDKESVVLSTEDATMKAGRRIHFSEMSINDLWKTFIIHPESQGKFVWDIYISLLIVFVLFITTTQVSFSREVVGVWFDFDILVTVSFFVDILLSFITASKYKRYDAFIAIHSEIARRYLKTWFLLDAVSTIPFDQIAVKGGGEIQLVKILRMLRILRVFKLIKLGDIIYSLDAHYSFFRVLIKGLSLLGSIVLACHLVACIWWVFSRDLTTNSWIDITSETYNTNLRDAPLEHQYVTSLYFSYITLLGIGYGDIVPANTPERIVVCVIMLCGSTLIVNITLASVSGIVRRFIAGAKQDAEHIMTTRSYLRSRKANPVLSSNIISFLDARSKFHLLHNERSLLSHLPTHLKEEIMFVKHFSTLKKIPIFNFIENRSVVIHLYNLFTVSYYAKNEYIFREGELVSDIKFLVEGSAKLFKNLMPKIQRRGKLRSIEHPKAPLQTENSTVNESWSSSSDQKFFNPKLAIDDDVLSIEHRAPDEKTHLLVKQVHAGHAFLRTFIHKKDHQICSAWTTEPSSVYSLSREHLSKLISEHPSLAVDLQSAFVGVFQEQEEAEDMRKDAAQRLKFIEDLVKLQEASQPTKRPSSLERIQATCFPWRRRVHRPRFSECAGNYADVSSVTGNDDTTDDLLKQRRRSVSDPSVVPPVSIFEKNLIPSTASARRPLSQQQFDGKRPPSRRRSISDPSSS